MILMRPKCLIYLYIMHIQCLSFIMTENPLLMAAENCDQKAKTAQCVLKLSAKYFVEKKALSGSIVIMNINSYASTTQKLLLPTIHSGIKYSVMIKDSFYRHANASHFPEKAKNYMLILEDKTELTRNILQLNKLPTWNPLAKAIVLYQLRLNETGENIAIEFINELRMYKLYTSIIFLHSRYDAGVVSYTWRPYSDTNCGGRCTSVYILDICKEETVHQVEKQKELFPLNMKGCPLVTHAVIAEPYVMPPVKKLDNTQFHDAYTFDKGSEIKLVKLISHFTNMTLIVRMSDQVENWGTIDAQGNATGAFGILRNDNVDLVIGNIEVTRTIRKWFNPTISYTQDEMTWCVPKSRRASTWHNLVIIFQWTTWVATFVSVLVMGLIFHCLYYIEHQGKVTKWPTNSLLMTFSMLLGWATSFRPKSTAFRILIFVWLCFSINMAISYESFLRSFLMHPRFEKQISNEADLIKSKIPLGGREIYRSYFETNNASLFYLYRKYNSTTFSEGIRRAAVQGNFAVVSSRRQAEYQDQTLGKGAPLIYCFSESNNLYKYGVVLLTRKWFPMLDRFNWIIRRLSENGLIDKWNKEMILRPASGEDIGTILPLSSQHLLGAFMFIGFMYAASVAVFISELIFGFIETRTKRAKGNMLQICAR